MEVRRANPLRWIVPLGGLSLLAVLFLRLGPSRIAFLFESIGFNLVIIVAIFAAHECVRALALNRCLAAGHRPPFRRLLWIRFFGEAVRTLTQTGPFLSEPARAWMLSRQAVQGAHAFGAAVSELIVNSCASALVTVMVLGYVLVTFDSSRQLVVLTHVLFWSSLVWVLIAVVALAARVYLIGAIVRGVRAIPLIGRRLKASPAQVRQMEDAIFATLRDRPAVLAQVVVLEFVCQAILVFEIYWTIRSMRLPASMTTALLVEALTKLANAIQLVGATEGGYAVVFNWLGMAAAVGFTLSLVQRVRSLVVAGVGLGLLLQIDRISNVPARPTAPPRP